MSDSYFYVGLSSFIFQFELILIFPFYISYFYHMPGGQRMMVIYDDGDDGDNIIDIFYFIFLSFAWWAPRVDTDGHRGEDGTFLQRRIKMMMIMKTLVIVMILSILIIIMMIIMGMTTWVVDTNYASLS